MNTLRIKKKIFFLFGSILLLSFFLIGFALWSKNREILVSQPEKISLPQGLFFSFTKQQHLLFWNNEKYLLSFLDISNNILPKQMLFTEKIVGITNIVWSPTENGASIETTNGKFVLLFDDEKTIPLPKGAIGVTWSPDGQFLAYQTFSSESQYTSVISILDIADQNVLSEYMIDMSDHPETTGQVLLYWIEKDRLWYAPEVTDGGVPFWYPIEKNTIEKRKNFDRKNIGIVDVSPDGSYLLYTKPTEDIDRSDFIYGILNRETEAEINMDLTATNTTCAWQTNSALLCLKKENQYFIFGTVDFKKEEYVLQNIFPESESTVSITSFLFNEKTNTIYFLNIRDELYAANTLKTKPIFQLSETND